VKMLAEHQKIDDISKLSAIPDMGRVFWEL
jgi:hypothetical protein